MRVIQLLPELNEGGVERGVIELVSEFSKNSIESVVISGGGKLVSTLTKMGAHHEYCNVFSKNIFSFIPRVFALRKILKKIKPDIIHVRSRMPAWLLFFAKRGLNFRVISTIHGLNSVNFYSKIMIRADHIICVSNCVKEHILRHFNAPEQKISVVFRGVNLDEFNELNFAKMADLRAKFGYNAKDFIISCVGRISPTKDIKTLLKAVKILSESMPNVRLIVAGGVHKKRQGYFKSLLNLTKELKIEKNVNFIGSVNSIAQIYKLSNIVVSASIKPESFGRSVAEALALNTPVVATNHGGVLDIIREGENGYFFTPQNEQELASKILLAKELKFDGFSYIKENFNLKKMSEETIKIYKEILK